MYEVKMVGKEEKKVTALVLHTTFVENKQAEEIPPFFHKVMEEETLESVPDRINENQLCAIVKDKNSPEFDYYMGVETAHFDNTPQGMKNLTIPSGKYAGGIPRAIHPLPENHPRFDRSFNERATEVRIDYVQHALSAMLNYREHFFKKCLDV